MNKLILLITLFFLTTGCSNRLQTPENQSGFLSQYHLFRPVPANEQAWFRTKQGFKLEDLTHYQDIAIAPIELWLQSNQPYQIKDKAKQKRLTAYFEQQITSQLKGEYQSVPQGTKGALLIEIAITNLEEKTPELELMDILPFRIAINAGESAYRMATQQKAVIANAGIEVKLVDTNSGDELLAVIMNSTSGEINTADNDENIDSIKGLIDGWVKKLINTIEGNTIN